MSALLLDAAHVGIAIEAVGEFRRQRHLGRLGAMESLGDQRSDRGGRWPFLADEGVDDRARFDQAVEHALLADPLDQVHRSIGGQMDRVGVIGDIGISALEHLHRLLVVEFKIGLCQTAGGGFGRRFLERELQMMFFGQTADLQVHVGDHAQAVFHRGIAVMQLLAGDELEGIVEADQADDVGAGIEIDIRLAVVGLLADLVERPARFAHHDRALRLLLQMRLDAKIHRLVELLAQPFQRLLAVAGGPVGGLRDVDGDILETAEAHRFRMPHHVVVGDRGAQAAAGGQRHLVAVEDEIGRAILARQLARFHENGILGGIGVGILADMEIALGELEDAAVAVAILPDLQQGAGEAAGLFLVVAVDDDLLAARRQLLLDLGIIDYPVRLGDDLAQDQAAAAGLGQIQLHHPVAVRILFGEDHLFQLGDAAIGQPQHVVAARPDRRHRLHVFGDAGVDVEIEEQGLAAAREGILRAIEDQFLRHLPQMLVVHADQVGGVEDVDVGDAKRAGVVRLHRRQEGVEMAGEHRGAAGRL